VPKHIIKSKPKIRTVPLNSGLPSIPEMMEELENMRDVLLGREEPPIQARTLTLMEVADAYYARAAEMTMLIQQRERVGSVLTNSSYYKFRNGELRTFMEIAKHAADLGSRRLTQAALEWEQSQTGRESR
jgi:hypothetical protein